MSQKGGFMATQEQGAEMIAREDMTEIMGTEQIPAEAVLPGSAGAAISTGGFGNFGMQQNGSYPQIIPNSPTFQVRRIRFFCRNTTSSWITMPCSISMGSSVLRSDVTSRCRSWWDPIPWRSLKDI